MKKKSIFILAVIVVLSLLGYMVTFTVEDNESVILLTFGAADENSVINKDGQSAGINFKLPSPIQTVVRVDRRVDMLNSPMEELRLNDGQTVLVSAYMAWRIKDPLVYRKSLNNRENARQILIGQLRSAMNAITEYDLDELTNLDDDQHKLGEAKDKIKARLNEGISTMGVEVKSVGISRLGLPQAVSKQVNEEMQAAINRESQEVVESGNAESERIRSDADLAKSQIEDFASLYAAEIRSEGDRQAAIYYKEFQQNPDLVIFMRKLEALESILGSGTSTIILDPSVSPIDLMIRQNAEAKE